MSECINTTCPYCGVGCGVEATVVNRAERRIQVKGDSKHPANFGRLCSKGAALHETVGLQRRVLAPQIRGRVVHWNEALDAVARGFRSVVDNHGPQAVAIYGSGQLLTEDYYIANKLMKGFIGSANIDTNSRLCMASVVVAQQRAFGEDLVPCDYTDLEMADLVLLVGSNLAWCHPVIYQRLVAAKAARPQMKIVVLDPRRTATTDVADLFLPLKTNTDLGFFMGLFVYLADNHALDTAFVNQFVEGFEEALSVCKSRFSSLAAVADYCGVAEADLKMCFDWFAATERAVTTFSQGVNQSAQASDAINAIINCHLVTGRIGRPGMGPFSLTGQPNAMGGREVGGMASTLVAHMDFAPDNVQRVARFWDTQQVASAPGLKAVDMFEAIHRGEIKAVWILATNPAVSLPNAERVREALARCELVVVSEAINGTDTGNYASVVLPAATWGERDGTVTNSERRISRQRPLFDLPGQVKPDWWAMCEVARRMGYDKGFNFTNSYEIFTEYAALTGFENTPKSAAYRSLNIAALSELSHAQYNSLSPQRWPLSHQEGSRGESVASPFADRLAQSGVKARILAVDVTADTPAGGGSLVLNTGRLRDHWHTMSRTGLSPRLSRHIEEPFIAVNPGDAAARNLVDGGFADISSEQGRLVLPVVITHDQPVGQVFAPIHWTDAGAANACISRVTHNRVDGPSGQPDSKATAVDLSPVVFAGFSRWFLRQDLDIGCFGLQRDRDYWVRNTMMAGYSYDVGHADMPQNLPDYVRSLLRSSRGDATSNSSYDGALWLERQHSLDGSYRGCCLVDGRLQAAVFISPLREQLPPTSAIAAQFTALSANMGALSELVNVDAVRGLCQRSAICACANVTLSGATALLASGQADSLEALMELTAAGKNCGSCLPELRSLVASQLTSEKMASKS